MVSGSMVQGSMNTAAEAPDSPGSSSQCQATANSGVAYTSPQSIPSSNTAPVGSKVARS